MMTARTSNRVRCVTAKFGSMRKPQDWIVYPGIGKDDTITVQSDTRIARVNVYTGEGVLSGNKPRGAYFHDLMFALPFTFPMEFVRECVASMPVSGDRLDAGGVVRIA